MDEQLVQEFSLEGKVALITGGTRGIGRAIAQGLAGAGAAVYVTARKAPEIAETVAGLIADGFEADGFAGSAGDPEAVDAGVSHCMSRFGRLDVIINNAATNPQYGPLAEADMGAVQKVMQVNVEGPLRYIQAAWRVDERPWRRRGEHRFVGGRTDRTDAGRLQRFQGGPFAHDGATCSRDGTNRSCQCHCAGADQDGDVEGALGGPGHRRSPASRICCRAARRCERSTLFGQRRLEIRHRCHPLHRWRGEHHVMADRLEPLASPVLGEILRRGEVHCPDRQAIMSEDASTTYAALNRRANQFAHALGALGVSRQERVAFLGRNRIEYFEILFGASKAGVVTIPINWRLAPDEVNDVLADAAPALLVVEHEYEHLAQDAMAALGPKRVITLDDGMSPNWEALLAAQSDGEPEIAVSPDEVMFQLYTSGTTGAPKGVMVRHSNLVSTIELLADAWCFEPSCVVYVPYPAFHAVGNGWVILTLARGGTAILRRGVDPVDFIESVEKYRVTNTMMVPSVLQQVTETANIESANLSSLRYIVYGAAPIPEIVLERALVVMPECGFVHCYGLTEATGVVTNMSWAEHRPGTPRMRSCGRPFAWVEMRVVDASSGRDLGPGESGEVWTRSSSVMKGYWRRPVETAEALTAEGWLRTGDVGYVDEEGYLYLTDRVKDMIISGGENIFPAEVENVLYSCPGVRQVAVVGVPDDRWGETVKAIVVPEDGVLLTEAEVKEFTRERLAHYKCPSSVDFRTEPLPLNPTGKVLRRELREPFWVGRTTSIH